MTHSVNSAFNLFRMSILTSNYSSYLIKVIFPVIIYSITESAILTSLQLSISLLGSLLGSTLVRHLRVKSLDNIQIATCDAILFSGFIVLWISNGQNTTIIYLLSALEAILSTMKSGYIESYIGYYSKNKNKSRQFVIGKVRTLVNIASILGFGTGIPLYNLCGNEIVFIIISILYLCSSIMMANASISNDLKSGNRKENKVIGIGILLEKRFKNLTISHFYMSLALNVFNGTVVYILYTEFDVTTLQLSGFYVLTMVAALFGSYMLLKFTYHQSLSHTYAPILRASYVMLFFLSIFVNNYLEYLLVFSILNFVHAFCIALWQDMFQCESEPSEWKIVGSMRKTLVSISGVSGSVLGGYIIGEFGYAYTYTLAFVFSFLSLIYILKHTKNTNFDKVAE
ncbi:hypothetical protein ACSWFU_000286 [Vibrio vulnificus]